MAYTDSFTGLGTGTELPTYSSNWALPTGASTCIGDNTADRYRGQNYNRHNVNYYNATFAEAHYSKAVITNTTASNGGSGVAVRIQTGAESFYYAYWDDADDKIYCGQMVSGTATDWDTGITGSFTSGDTLELSIDGSTTTTVYCKVNGTTVATYTSKSALSGGKAGVMCRHNINPQGGDNWEGGDVASSSTVPRFLAQYRQRRR